MRRCPAKTKRGKNYLEGEDMDFYRARMGLKREIDSMSQDRWLEYDNRKFLPSEPVVRGGELRRVEDFVQNGQATQWDLEEASINECLGMRKYNRPKNCMPAGNLPMQNWKPCG